jgi:hypothetical protein
MRTKDIRDRATMRVLMHMVIYIGLIIWIIKSVLNMMYIDTPLRVQEGATRKALRNMSHHLGMPRIVIDTHHFIIVVNKNPPRNWMTLLKTW